MMDDDDTELLINFAYTVSFVRVINNMILPTTMKIDAELMPGIRAYHDNIEMSISKIKFWFDNVVSRAIAFKRDNALAASMFIDETGVIKVINNLMFTPYEPTDDHLAGLFQCKMAALSNDNFAFGAVKVCTNSSSGLAFTYVGLAEENLPTMKEWVGEKNYFKAPWWMRGDATTMDVRALENSNVDTKPSWAYDLDFIEKAFGVVDVEKKKKTGRKKSSRPSTPFKPTIIDGGKKD